LQKLDVCFHYSLQKQNLAITSASRGPKQAGWKHKG
jgi:hypothetical protein